MAHFKSINPKNNKLIKTYDIITPTEIKNIIGKSYMSFKFMNGNGM